MSDEMIKGILLEKKKQERRRQQKKEVVKVIIEEVMGWGSLIGIVYILAVIGG